MGSLAGVIVLVAVYFRFMYPHGPHPACARALKLALVFYAHDHDGKFPAGEATPEASLSLLYPEYASAEILAGKRKSVKIAERILASGGRLSPETCDWHYVEGLTDSDYSEIAIFWDKSNLDHAGRRMFDGSHEVFRIRSVSPEYIPASRWADFLAEQQRLLAAREAKVP